uniref:Uncharacterized protein n=1 Tax=viral metagenome TaxID=1070528 RepID=A0A6C0CRU6_9ZZZZ
MQELVTLDLGFQKFKVVKQAQIAFYTYLVTIVAIFIMLFMSPMNMGMVALVVVSLLLNLVLMTYGINCLVIGQCDTFAWAVVILIIINTAIVVYSLLNMLFSKKSSKSFGKRK